MLFTKTEWQALHTIFSYIFFILVIVHLFFVNWKTFLTYFKSKLKAGLNKKWELASAIIISAIIFAGTLRNWTPFGPVMTFGEKVKASWDAGTENPPVLHMELYDIRKLAVEFDSIAPEELLKTLNDNKIKASGTDQTLKEIANENNTTPAEIYKLLSLKYGKTRGPVEGEVPQGIGKYTVRSAAEKTGRDVETLVQLLKERGVEANGETTLREIADKLGNTPRDVYNMLAKK
jgi:hypothetical protein